MSLEIQLSVFPEDYYNEIAFRKIVAQQSGLSEKEIHTVFTLRRSIDARGRKPKLQVKVRILLQGESNETETFQFKARNVSDAKKVHIIGAGPAGLFAALKLIERGIKPVVFERGKTVRDRRRDLAAINKDHRVNPESNYCFGEGGAGTYSDGKLYTRSTKRGDVHRILSLLVMHGAHEDILIDAHPHIGTNKLPDIITRIRETILDCGGEIHFQSKLTDISHENGALKSITINDTEKHDCDQLILATGHSARDIYYLLHERKIPIESKTFALGVRAEHPQQLIDQIQYHCDIRSEYLPPASYALVEQIKGLGVYSFCMCPGGIIAPCATAQEEIVTNGWSPSRRNNPFANSGIVVTVDEKDLATFQQFGPLAALKFQEMVERKAWITGGKTQTAPAQRMVDFSNRKISANLPDCSYHPGVVSADLHSVLPSSISDRLALGFKAFGQKMKGYFTNEAILVAPESRTSSPVRIPRDPESLQHPQIKGLFPCGEGAGYAGGIVSAAIDGERCAEACS
jgi:uncharacterized FAD-dependent dehydrogenase